MNAELFLDTFAFLKEHGAELYVLHGYSRYPDDIQSDIDIVVKDPKSLVRLLASWKGAHLVQVLRHKAAAYSCFVVRESAEGLSCLHLDISRDYRSNVGTLFSFEQLTKGFIQKPLYRVPAPAVEFAYYITKKILKGVISHDQECRLRELYCQDPSGAKNALRHLFSENSCEAIARAAAVGRLRPLMKKAARRRLLARYVVHRPVATFAYWAGNLGRLIGRLRKPTGMTVILLGPDGAGKTTLIAHLLAEAGQIFRRRTVFHLRPHFRLQWHNSPPVMNPHGAAPRHLVISVLKFGWWLLDYWISGFQIKLQRAKSTLAIFDRDLHDILVDPFRYRYSGPSWIPELMVSSASPTIRPDLILVLYAGPEIIASRKRELPLEVITAQCSQYVLLSSKLPNCNLIDASGPLREVAGVARHLLIEHMVARTALQIRDFL